MKKKYYGAIMCCILNTNKATEIGFLTRKKKSSQVLFKKKNVNNRQIVNNYIPECSFSDVQLVKEVDRNAR